MDGKEQQQEQLNCDVCGSCDFQLDAGFYFCQECGTQQQGRRETIHEMEMGRAVGAKIGKSKKKRDEERKQRENFQKLLRDPYLGERALPKEDYPRWLEAIGARIGTATKLVVKCSHTMVQQFQVPQKCMNYSQMLFKAYLQKAGIAFCVEETTEEQEEAFCLTIKRTISELAQLRAKQNKALKERKKRAHKKKQLLDPNQSQSTFLEQLSSLQFLQQDQELDELQPANPSDQAQTKAADEAMLEITEKINTSLSVDAVNMAASIYLGIDLLLSLVYLATQMCGCQWILLSDVFRWYREGRFHITHSQLCALNFSLSWTTEHMNPQTATAMRAVERRFYSRGMFSNPYLGIQPTSESLRVLAFFTQFTQIPRSIPTMGLNKVIARLLYNLNLPHVFIKHLQAITAILPSVNSSNMGADQFSHTMPIQSGFRACLLSLVVQKDFSSYGYVTFLNRAFAANHAQPAWTKAAENIGNYKYNNLHFVTLPLEVKAAAVLLLALKLFFGLDGHREFQIRPKQNERRNNEENLEDHFDFGQWLTQLEMRTHCWQGTSAYTVLGKNFCANQLERSDPHVMAHKRGNQQMEPTLFLSHYRSIPFAGCVPNTIFNRAQPNLFENLFPNQHANPPADVHREEETDCSKEALYTPLQFQAQKNKDIHIEDAAYDGELDGKRIALFFRQFYKSKMDLELPIDDGAGQQTEPTANENVKALTALFPCAKFYSRIPPPPMKCFTTYVPKRDQHGLFMEQIKNTKVLRLNDVPISPVLLHKQLKTGLMCSEHFLSPSFRSLLRHLALAIAETDHLLFFTFLLVESMFFDKEIFDRFQWDLRQKGRTMFTAHMLDRPYKQQARFTINLQDSFNEEKRQNAKLHEFRYKLTRAPLRIFGIDKQNEQIARAEQEGGDNECNGPTMEGLLHQKITFPNPIPSQQQGEVENLGDDEQQEEQMDDEEETRPPSSISLSSSSSSSSSSSEDGIDNVLDTNPGKVGENALAGLELAHERKKYRPVKLLSLPAPATFALCAFQHW